MKSIVLGCLLFMSGLGPVMAQSWSSCHQDGIREAVRCTDLSVPEDPADPEGPQLSLNLVKLPAVSASPAASPLVFLAGGPGQAATELSAFIAQRLRQVREQRDIILVDQRGTGESNPLQCEFSHLSDWLMPDAELDLAAAAAACAAELEADLQHYHTHAAIADLEYVRLALGVEQWHVYGGSYGSRVALEYARLHPQALASMTLDGVVPGREIIGLFGTETQSAWQGVVQDCLSDQACVTQFPALAMTYEQLLDDLAAEPVALQLADGRSGEPTPFLLTAPRLAGFIRNALYHPHSRQLVPYVVHAIAAGEYQAISGLVNSFTDTSPLYFGLLLSVVCQEDIPRARSAQWRAEAEQPLYAGQLSDDFRQLCSGWPVDPAPHIDQLAEQHVIDVPALLLSGGQDPVTPPQWAEQVLPQLTRGQHLVAPAGGHTIMGHTCANRLVADFIQSPESEVTGRCLGQHPQLPFVRNRNAAGM